IIVRQNDSILLLFHPVDFRDEVSSWCYIDVEIAQCFQFTQSEYRFYSRCHVAVLLVILKTNIAQNSYSSPQKKYRRNFMNVRHICFPPFRDRFGQYQGMFASQSGRNTKHTVWCGLFKYSFNDLSVAVGCFYPDLCGMIAFRSSLKILDLLAKFFLFSAEVAVKGESLTLHS